VDITTGEGDELTGDATLNGRQRDHGAQTGRAPGSSRVRCQGKGARITSSAGAKAASRISTAARPGADLAAGRSRGRPVLFRAAAVRRTDSKDGCRAGHYKDCLNAASG
jgi:hypothetical protein